MKHAKRPATSALSLVTCAALLVLVGCDVFQASSTLDPNPSKAAYLNLVVKGSGRVVPDPAPDTTGTYPKGTVVALTAVGGGDMLAFNFMLTFNNIVGKDFLLAPVFTKWEGDASGTDSSVSVTMDADKQVTATFTLEGVKEVDYPSGTQRLYNNGPVMASSTLTYNEDGKLVSCDDWGTTGALLAQTTFQYNADGQVSEYDLRTPPPDSSLLAVSGVPVVIKYVYGTGGALSVIDRYDYNSNLLDYITYTYNSDNKISQITQTDAITSAVTMRWDMSYDSLGRLSSVDIYNTSNGTLAKWGTVTLTFDTNGKVTEMDVVGTGQTMNLALTYDTSGLLTKIADSVSGFEYDMSWTSL